MRLVTYNILNGGEGRADPLAEVIEAQRPDVVALIEADVPATVERIARRLRMDFIISPGEGHASALLSRWPITQSINHAAVNAKISRSLLEATVLTDGQELPIFVLHLPAGATDADEQKRMQILPAVLNAMEKYRAKKTPHLICGDFNSNAPRQKIDIHRCKQRTQNEWQNNGRQIPVRVIQAMTDAGYLDTYAQLHNEQAELIGSFSTQHPGQRVDYIFSFGIEPSQIKSSWIEQDRLAKYASDHFPIGVEL